MPPELSHAAAGPSPSGACQSTSSISILLGPGFTSLVTSYTEQGFRSDGHSHAECHCPRYLQNAKAFAALSPVAGNLRRVPELRCPPAGRKKGPEHCRRAGRQSSAPSIPRARYAAARLQQREKTTPKPPGKRLSGVCMSEPAKSK